MIVFPGSHVLTAAEIGKIRKALAEDGIKLLSIYTEYFYLVDAEGSLENDHITDLHSLLKIPSTKLSQNKPNSDNVEQVLVIPRIGTQSPWSSKATDILQLCGYQQVHRIERGRKFLVATEQPLTEAGQQLVRDQLTDPMVDAVISDIQDARQLFKSLKPETYQTVDILGRGIAALEESNRELGLALSPYEREYLVESFLELQRNPTDVELMMFSQANSEHCRHKIFNSPWQIGGADKPHTLFGMIRNTSKKSPKGLLSAYKDNGAVFEGYEVERFGAVDNTYGMIPDTMDVVIKVETHNHPTAISPYPGAATGSGGEIRDEGATGRGARPKAGLCGFAVSHLRIPHNIKPWEGRLDKPDGFKSSYEIMRDGPLGAAGFNNEFGRPALGGFFRSFEVAMSSTSAAGADRQTFGYHKPIMIAGGVGNIRRQHVNKQEDLPVGTPVLVLGGPGMLIGLGGGAASSVDGGSAGDHDDKGGKDQRDYASVQRDNAEMQRRCQEVLTRCTELGADNPIAFIHDVGAGGLSNALPELIKDAAQGGEFDLRKVPMAESGLTPLEIWCNESQERYVLAVTEESLGRFRAIAERERCPFAVVGKTTDSGRIVLSDRVFGNKPVDIPLKVLFGAKDLPVRQVTDTVSYSDIEPRSEWPLDESISRVLNHPTVADKSFLITIGDRSVSGLVSQDQMVGPWQVPVSDVAVTATAMDSTTGEAMAMGERAPLAVRHPAASARMAVAEAITNIVAADVPSLGSIKLSANWQAAPNHADEGRRLYEAVEAIGMDFCPKLGIAIPVGKDSLSMKAVWSHGDGERNVVSPVSLVISAFAPVEDISKTLTPQLKDTKTVSSLLLIDLAAGKNRLGGSILHQVYGGLGGEGPDCEDAETMVNFFSAMADLKAAGLIHAYHDRSDGGLLTTLVEMAIAGRKGLVFENFDGDDLMGHLFAEELGAVIQVQNRQFPKVKTILRKYGLEAMTSKVASIAKDHTLTISHKGQVVHTTSLPDLVRDWSEVSYLMAKHRDDPDCAEEEYSAKQNMDRVGLHVETTFDPDTDIAAPFINAGAKPRVAILREQGVNSQLEMAAAFYKAGFEPVDVHMSEVMAGAVELKDFNGLGCPGGFSFGDVLGGGGGWAKTILHNEAARSQFADYFADTSKFVLGICNGCQMLAHLKPIIPGADSWPVFVTNRSQRFEARLSQVEVVDSPSIFFQGMAGSRIPIVVAHGEGRAEFSNQDKGSTLKYAKQVCLQFVDGAKPAERYPANPSGSPQGITGITNEDGRITLTMPHPERVHRLSQFSYYPSDRKESTSPWLRLFANARVWVG